MEWEIKRLGEIASIYDGTHQTPRYTQSGVPFYSVEQVTGNDFDSTKFISEAEFARLSKSSRIERGDVLMTRIGSIGDCKYVDWDVRAGYYVSLALLKFRNATLASYFTHYSRSAAFKQEIELHSLAHAIPRKINLGPISHVRLPVPPAEEQMAIAECLSDAEALIDSLEQLLIKKRQIKQGAMQDLLTGKRRLPGFAGDWTCAPLGEIARIKTGSMNNQDKVEDGEFPFFVRSQSVERIDTYTHDCEAILIPGEGGIGSIFHYFHGRFALHQRVYGITDFSESVLGRFVYFFMRVFFGPHAMENSVKATVDSLRLPTFMTFEVRLPPTVAEQTAIVEVLSDLEVNIAALEERLTKARALNQAMAQALLTGRIRLVEPTA